MSASITSGKSYAFANWSTQKVIDLFGGQSNPGTKVISFQAHMENPANQTWTVTSDDGQYFTIKSNVANLAIDVTGSGPSGTPVIGWGPTGQPNQLWKFVNASSSGETPSWFIQCKNNGIYLTVPNGSDQNATQLTASSQGGDNRAAWQRFVAYPVSG